MNVARISYILVLIACVLGTTVQAKTVFRRTDKIDDNFKKVELPPEEIDPNVAPEPQKIETIDPQTVSDTIEGAMSTIPVEVFDVDTNTVDENAIVPETPLVVISSPDTTTPPAAVETTVSNQDEVQNGLGQYCKCTESHCDCCRDFRLPLLPIVRGPGCARVAFLGNDKMSVSLKYGDLTLASRTISGKRAKPICVGLPGGYSQFCGRVYGLSRSQDNFKACLGFELRADDEVEAALRVSCFKFGPKGLRVAESEPLPSEVKDEEDDDDDDIFGFGAGADEDEDDEEDDYDEEEADENDDDDTPVEPEPDYDGFSLGSLLEELADDDDDTIKKPAVQTNIAPTNSNNAAQTRHVQTKEAATEGTNLLAEISTTHSKTKAKKKKAVSTADTDYAYDIFTGVMEFFN